MSDDYAKDTTTTGSVAVALTGRDDFKLRVIRDRLVTLD